MHIWNLNAKRAFSEAFNANVAETEAAFRQRRHTMDNAWDEVDQHCKALGKRMMEVGIAKPSGSEEAMLRLNVGGAPVNIRRSALEGRGHLGSLFESVWDKRLPRDADGLIVVDLSPKCLKHVIHTLLSSRDADSTKERLKSGDGLPADEKVYFPYLASAIGLAERPAIKVIGGCTPPARPAIKVIGGSTVMEGDDLLPMSSALLNWCPGQPAALELVYRATRDGWTPQAFHARCGADSPYTITLYRVPVGVNSTVVGGFSSASWALTPVPTYRSSPEAFLFMLKDGTMPQWGPFLPVKWAVRREHADHAVYSGGDYGAWFGSDLGMSHHSLSVPPHPFWNQTGSLTVGNATYQVPAGASFLNLRGCSPVEMETFRVSYEEKMPSAPPRKPGLTDIPAFDASTVSTDGGRDDPQLWRLRR